MPMAENGTVRISGDRAVSKRPALRVVGERVTPAGFRKTLARIGEASELVFPVHPHMLRHACGFKLANDGRDTRAPQHYLGHRNIQHTVRYTELTSTRFNSFWRD